MWEFKKAYPLFASVMEIRWPLYKQSWPHTNSGVQIRQDENKMSCNQEFSLPNIYHKAWSEASVEESQASSEDWRFDTSIGFYSRSEGMVSTNPKSPLFYLQNSHLTSVSLVEQKALENIMVLWPLSLSQAGTTVLRHLTSTRHDTKTW